MHWPPAVSEARAPRAHHLHWMDDAGAGNAIHAAAGRARHVGTVAVHVVGGAAHKACACDSGRHQAPKKVFGAVAEHDTAAHALNDAADLPG